MEQALAIAVKRLGEQHPQTVAIASWLADSKPDTESQA